MKIVQFIEFLQRHLRTVVRLCLALLAVLVVLDALPFVVDKSHAHGAVEKFPGFWAVFGLGGCILLILFAKTFGHLGVVKREDYYDE